MKTTKQFTVVGIYYVIGAEGYLRDKIHWWNKHKFTLHPEPLNIHDSNAILVRHKTMVIGYIARSQNEVLLRAMRQGTIKIRLESMDIVEEYSLRIGPPRIYLQIMGEFGDDQ